LRAVVVPELLIVKAFVVWTFVAVMYRFPVTARFETERYSMFAFPGTYRFENVASGPEKFMTEETLRSCVLMYGIVNVSKKNVAFAAFADMDPLTLNVSRTVTFVRFDVPYTFSVLVPYTTAELTVKYPTFIVAMFARDAMTFVVVTEFETYKFPSPVYETLLVAPATPDETRYTKSPGFPDGAGPVAPVSPVAPVAPVDPVAPVAPVDPVAPVAPSNPVAPVDPVAPVAPVDPVAPVAPSNPVAPVDPVAPVAPVDPVAPVAPSNPVAPVDPVAPVAPVDPVAPVAPSKPVAPVDPVAPVAPIA